MRARYSCFKVSVYEARSTKFVRRCCHSEGFVLFSFFLFFFFFCFVFVFCFCCFCVSDNDWFPMMLKVSKYRRNSFFTCWLCWLIKKINSLISRNQYFSIYLFISFCVCFFKNDRSHPQGGAQIYWCTHVWKRVLKGGLVYSRTHNARFILLINTQICKLAWRVNYMLMV